MELTQQRYDRRKKEKNFRTETRSQMQKLILLSPFEAELAGETCRPNQVSIPTTSARWPAQLTDNAFNRLRRPSKTLPIFCCGQNIIASAHCAYPRRMARLSWFRWLFTYQNIGFLHHELKVGLCCLLLYWLFSLFIAFVCVYCLKFKFCSVTISASMFCLCQK